MTHRSHQNMREQCRGRKLASRRFGEWKHETREIIYALSIGSEWNEATRPAVCYRTIIYTEKNDKMKLPKFLRLPKFHRRTRSKARSEIGPIEGQGEPDPTVPRPTESTPDLRIGTSTLPALGPSTPRDENSGGM